MYPRFLIWGPKESPKAVSIQPLGLKCSLVDWKILSGISENLVYLRIHLTYFLQNALSACKARPSVCISTMAVVGNSVKHPARVFFRGHLTCALLQGRFTLTLSSCSQGGQETFSCWSQWSRTVSLFPQQGWKMCILSLSPSHTYFLFFIEQVVCLYLTIHLSLWLQLMELSPLCTHVPFLNLSGLWPPKVTTASEVIWLSESF